MAAMAQPKKTLYQILGIPRDASSDDIGLAHEMKSAEVQRANPPDPSAVSLVNQAHEILSNPARRAAYDASLVSAAEKQAAAQQAQAPDLELEGASEDDERKRKLRLGAMIGGMALILIVLFLAFRPKAPAPPPVEPVAEAPKPAPPPPRLRTGAEILAAASTSGGQLMSYSMSGSADPVGIALAIDPGQMVTTCHGLPAGSKLVVKVGAQMHPADLNITDEELDLCRLSVAGFTSPPLRLAREDAKAGDKIFAVGVNAKGDFAATEGTVSQVRSTARGKVLEVSVPIAPNASGGGIFNPQGQLVGIATTPHAFGAGLNIALPVSGIAEMRSRATPPK